MKIRMELLSDTVFGNGVSVPGGEDISVLCDADGFPYYKGGTFKGVFREELERYFLLTAENEEMTEAECVSRCDELLGTPGSNRTADAGKIVFSDFTLSKEVRGRVLQETGSNHAQTVLEACTHLRTFTAIDDDGQVAEGSLRSCRCVNKGLVFYSEIICRENDQELIREVLGLIKWIGSMRNRGFGKVRVEAYGGGVA